LGIFNLVSGKNDLISFITKISKLTLKFNQVKRLILNVNEKIDIYFLATYNFSFYKIKQYFNIAKFELCLEIVLDHLCLCEFPIEIVNGHACR